MNKILELIIIITMFILVVSGGVIGSCLASFMGILLILSWTYNDNKIREEQKQNGIK
jgi:hypothetical protein